MVQLINIYHKESERRVADSKQITADLEDAANITINSSRLFMQEKQIGDAEDLKINPYGKMRLIRVIRKTLKKILKAANKIWVMT